MISGASSFITAWVLAVSKYDDVMSAYSVSECLKELSESGEVPLYVIAPGNAGDCLISVGFFHLAEKLGLNYKTCSEIDQPMSSSTVIFGGGGGLGGGWSNNYRDAMLARAKTGNRLIIMPQTIQGSEDFLASLGENVTLFVREQRSLEHVTRHATNGCRIALDHDTALHADVTSLVSGRPRNRRLITRPKELARRALYELVAASSIFRRSIDAFRTDIEAANNANIPRTIRRDLSLISFFGNSTEDQCRYTAAMFLHLINRFDSVRTDRLHVAVGAALLGKKVVLYDNSYFKCRAVYEMSLNKMNVEMHSVA